MKILVENYTFNSSTKQVTLTDYTSISLESVLLITNVTDNIIIYNFADPAKGGSVSGNILTLDYDTSTMSNGDALQIFIEDGQKSASESTVEALKDVADYLKVLVNQTKTLATQDTAQRQRVAIDSSVAYDVRADVLDSNNVNVFSRGTNAYGTNFALPDVWNTMELARINYQTNIRSKLIF
jgi:hypothetical protein